MHTLIDLKAKVKDKKWFQDFLEYVSVNHIDGKSPNFELYSKLYEIQNNDISRFEDELKWICNPLESFGEVADALIPYNKLKNKLQILEGEFLKRPNNHKVVLMSNKAIANKNEQLYEKILKGVDEDLALEIRKNKLITEGANPSEVEEIVKQQREKLTPKDINYNNFLSELEIYKNQVVKYAYAQENIKVKKLGGLKDIITTDGVVIYSGWKNGKPSIEEVNLLYFGCEKAPDEMHIEKSEVVWYTSEIALSDFLVQYGEGIEKEDLEKLLTRIGAANLSGDLAKIKGDYSGYLGTLQLYNGQNTGEKGLSENVTTQLKSNFLTRKHIEFKAFREVVYFTYKDEYDEPITILLDAAADIIPSTATKVKYNSMIAMDQYKYVWQDEFGSYEAIKQHIPRRYEIVEVEDLMVIHREVANQPDYIERPFSDFELSYKGLFVSGRNAQPTSLLQNALPYQFQIYAIKHIQNREIASYQSYERQVDVSQISDELALDSEGNSVLGRDKINQTEVIARKTKTRYFDGSRQSDSLQPNHTRGAGVTIAKTGFAQEIVYLNQLVQAIDQEMGIAMGIPPAREAQVTSGTNVTDNRQSLIQGSLVTEIYFYFLDYVYNRGLNDYLNNFDTWARMQFDNTSGMEKISLEYFTADHVKELLEITPDKLTGESVGLYVLDASADRMYTDYLLQNLHPIAQNAGQGANVVSDIIRMISNTASSEEINKKIMMYADEQQKIAQQKAEDDRKAMEMMENKRMELIKFESQLRVSEAAQIDNNREEFLLKKAEVDATRFAQAKDIDKDMQNDDVEASMYATDKKHEIDKEKNQIEWAKLKANPPSTNK